MNLVISSMPSEQRTALLCRLETEQTKRQARHSLTKWCEANGFKPAAHHRLIIRELEAVACGETKRLALFLPPGSAKSTYASILFPPWFFSRSPSSSIIAASHTAELAEKFGRRVRRLVADHSETLNVDVSSESSAAGRWDTDKGGEYFAAGVGGSITGRRADCVVGSTIVQTIEGPKRIDNIEVGTKNCYVLSYDKASGSCAYKRVVAIARREANEIWRIHTSSGRVVEATGNHLFYLGGRWSPASSIVVGDKLLRTLRETDRAQGLRSSKAYWKELVLLPAVQHGFNKCFAWIIPAQVLGLRYSSAFKKVYRKKLPVLLRGMQEGQISSKRCETSHCIGENMRILRDCFQTQQFKECCQVLFERLQGQGTRKGYFGRIKSRIQAWSRQFTWQSKTVFLSQAEDLASGQFALCGLQFGLASGRSSYKYEPYRQQAGEFGHALSKVPHKSSRGGEVEAEQDTVSLVERVCGKFDVWDIQVEDTSCFFANDILVHNCAIIDDPIRSREDADSKLIRDKQWDWYKFDLSTRLKPDARVILIQTRWHCDDLAGRILEEEADRWKVVSLPMEATSHDDPLGRSLGQPLWPEWFNDEMRSDAKRDSRVWSALYQQQPTPDEGGLFKRDWFHPVNSIPDRDTMMVYGGSDYAVTSNGGDYTVHCVVGLDPDGEMYLLDVWRKQASSDEWVDAWCDLVRKWKPMAWAEETGQIKSGVGPFLERRAVERQAYCVREQFPTRGDKAVRAQSIRGRMAMRGLRILKDAPWRAEFESELLRFPAGVHDDQVDALGLVGQLLDRMLAGTKPRPSEQPRKDRYERDDDDFSGSDWKVV